MATVAGILRIFVLQLLRTLRHHHHRHRRRHRHCSRRHHPRLPSPSLFCVLWCLVTLSLDRGGLVVGRLYPAQSLTTTDTIVETQFGKLSGILVTLPNKNLPQVAAYFGLQYASVLGGELRFMPPTGSLEKWDGVRAAIRPRPVCPQRIPADEELRRRMPLGRVAHFKRIIPFLEKQNEECLNLNVYVPVRDKNDTSPMAVVLFVHGETYEFGTGNAYDGSVMASYGNVIVITLNYRLGILGFLSLDDSNAPGNYALLDLVAGLHWIKENIHAFGGNPNSVCLFGHGHGAAMVHLLLISPVTKGRDLFQRAIMHSGSALSSWAIAGDPLRYIDELSSRTNCSLPSASGSSATGGSGDSSRSFLQCLKQLPVDALARLDLGAPKYLSAFGPTIDQRIVLPSDVRSMMSKLSESVFARTKLLVGVARSEGLDHFTQDDLERGLSADRTTRMLRTFVQNVFSFHRQSILDVLTHQYNDWERPSRDSAAARDSLIELLGDSQVTAPVVELAQYHALHGTSTYFFVFNAPPRLDVYPRWASGAPGDDVAYAFGAPVTDGIAPFPQTYMRSDRALADAVLKYWTNFIKTGDPNTAEEESSGITTQRSRTKSVDPHWPIYDFNKQEYLIIEKKSQDRGDDGVRSNIRHHYRASKMALWLDLIPRLHKSDDLDPRFHQLENSSDRSTFEDEGTKDLDLAKPAQETASRSTTGGSTQRPLFTGTASTTSRRPSSSAATRGGRRTTWVPSMPPPGQPSTGVWMGEQRQDAVDSTSSSLLSLRVTIGIGSALLVLNLLIFAGLCYQKERVRREMRMGTRFLDHLLRGKANQDLHLSQQQQQQQQHNDVYSVRPSPGDVHQLGATEIPVDANGGSGVPRSISIPRHQLVAHSPLSQGSGQSSLVHQQQHNLVQRSPPLPPPDGPYTMMLSRCLVPPSPCPPQPTQAANHVDLCRDGGLLLKYLPTTTDFTTIDGSEEHACTNPSTVV